MVNQVREEALYQQWSQEHPHSTDVSGNDVRKLTRGGTLFGYTPMGTVDNTVMQIEAAKRKIGHAEQQEEAQLQKIQKPEQGV